MAAERQAMAGHPEESRFVHVDAMAAAFHGHIKRFHELQARATSLSTDRLAGCIGEVESVTILVDAVTGLPADNRDEARGLPKDLLDNRNVPRRGPRARADSPRRNGSAVHLADRSAPRACTDPPCDGERRSHSSARYARTMGA